MKDKIAIVTGGAKGIGREIAVSFAKAGANIGVVDVDTKNLKIVEGEIQKLGRNVIASRVDTSQSHEVRNFVRTIVSRFDGIDVLINCAAIIAYDNFLDFGEELWRRMVDVDLTGYFIFSQAVAKNMVKRRKGWIINISSVAAEFGAPGGAAYCAVKAGILALTRVMSLELGPLGINVNAISPGPVDNAQLRRLLTVDQIEARKRSAPLGRLATPEDVAKAALFLASEDAKHITGEVLHVDGGILATRK